MPRSCRSQWRQRVAELGERFGAEVVSHVRHIPFQMAEVTMLRRMFADILSLIAGLRSPPRQHEGRGADLRQATAAEDVRLDAAKNSAVAFWYLPAPGAICHCPTRSRARSWARNRRGSGECRMRPRASPLR
jgi:hypothetical protein